MWTLGIELVTRLGGQHPFLLSHLSGMSSVFKKLHSLECNIHLSCTRATRVNGQAEVQREGQRGSSKVPALHCQMFQDKIRLDCGPGATLLLFASV